jgi:hypothetical protein
MKLAKGKKQTKSTCGYCSCPTIRSARDSQPKFSSWEDKRKLDHVLPLDKSIGPFPLQSSTIMGGVTCTIISYKVPLDSFHKYALNIRLNTNQAIKAVTAHLSSTLSTPIILVPVDTEISNNYMLCCHADTTKPMYDCAEILLTKVAPAFEQIPTLIETEGGLCRIIANRAHVFCPMRRLDKRGHT